MHQVFIQSEAFQEVKAILSKDQFKHVSQVLRVKKGEFLTLVIDQHVKIIVEVSHLQDNTLFFEVKNKIYPDKKKVEFTLFQCLPKQDKFSDIINACTQLGVHEVVPVLSERVITKLTHSKIYSKTKRWELILESASAQSQRFDIPRLAPAMSLRDLPKYLEKSNIDLLLFAWEEDQTTFLSEILQQQTLHESNISIGIIIGPEGGISLNEASYLKSIGCKSFTLGKTILRVEIAAISVLSQLKYFYRL